MNLPDFNGGSTDFISADLSAQTVFQVLDQGAGGTGNSSNGAFNHYDLTEVTFNLGPQFAGQTLNTATIASDGFETLLLGVTVGSTSSVAGVPEPATWAMMPVGFGALGESMHSRRKQVAHAA